MPLKPDAVNSFSAHTYGPDEGEDKDFETENWKHPSGGSEGGVCASSNDGRTFGGRGPNWGKPDTPNYFSQGYGTISE